MADNEQGATPAAEGGMDVKFWVVGAILAVIVVGSVFAIGGKGAKATEKAMEAAEAWQDKYVESSEIIGSSQAFIAKLKAENAEVYQATLEGLPMKDAKSIRKLLEAKPAE